MTLNIAIWSFCGSFLGNVLKVISRKKMIEKLVIARKSRYLQRFTKFETLTRKVKLDRLSRSRVSDRPRVSKQVQDVEGRVGLHQAPRCLHRHVRRCDDPQREFITQFGKKRHRFDTQTVFLNVTVTNTSPIQEIIFRNCFPIVLLESVELFGPCDTSR